MEQKEYFNGRECKVTQLAESAPRVFDFQADNDPEILQSDGDRIHKIIRGIALTPPDDTSPLHWNGADFIILDEFCYNHVVTRELMNESKDMSIPNDDQPYAMKIGECEIHIDREGRYGVSQRVYIHGLYA